MNIKDVSAQVGLPSKTIRYYEDIGLICPDRAANGYRDFSAAHVHQLTFLARARSLGFSIDACRDLLALWGDTARASSDVRAIAQSHLTQINAKIADLQDMASTLSHLVDTCAGDDRPDCPILSRLAAQPDTP